MRSIMKFLKCEKGATAIEYALIASAMGLVLIAVMPALESALDTQFTALAANMN